jgi:hypothetical protein
MRGVRRLFTVFAAPIFCQGTISTIAGNGTQGYSGTIVTLEGSQRRWRFAGLAAPGESRLRMGASDAKVAEEKQRRSRKDAKLAKKAQSLRKNVALKS